MTTPAPLTDPFFGLLTDPPGEWGLISYGGERALILKGDDQFKAKALNLLYSFYGCGVHQYGRHHDYIDSDWAEQCRPFTQGLHIKERDAHGNLMIPVVTSRLLNALKLWFYGRLCPHRAVYRQVLDEEGDLVEIEGPTNEASLLKEAASLALAFVAAISGHGCGCRFDTAWQGAPIREGGLGVLVTATGTED